MNSNESQPTPSQQSTADVFVIHGRNEPLRDAVFQFLRALGLNPLEWSEMTARTGKATPYVREILEAGFSTCGAIVALLSPDDLAQLHPSFLKASDKDHERAATPQARPNVLFETGLAMGRNPDRTIVVQVGELRPFSDLSGMHVVHFDGSAEARNELKTRLITAKCAVRVAGNDWLKVGSFGTIISALPRNGTKASAVTKKKDLPLIECIGLNYQYVNLDRATGYLSDVNGGDVAYLAGFRFAAGSDQSYVTFSARIDYRSDKGDIIQRVDYGRWLGENGSEIHMSRKDTKYLALAVRNSREQGILAPEARHKWHENNVRKVTAPCVATIIFISDNDEQQHESPVGIEEPDKWRVQPRHERW